MRRCYITPQLSSLSRLELVWDKEDTGALVILAEGLRQMVALQELKVDIFGPIICRQFRPLIGILPALPSLRSFYVRDYTPRRSTAEAIQDDPNAQSAEELLASVQRQCPLLKIVVEQRERIFGFTRERKD